MIPRLSRILPLVLLSLNPRISQSQWVQTMGDTSIVSFAVRGTRMFAGAYGEPVPLSGPQVFISEDDGNTWAPVGTLPGGSNVNALAFGGPILFAGTEGTSNYPGAVYLSSNNGVSWLSTGLSGQFYALAVNGTDLFAGADGGHVYLSTNYGISWSAASAGLPGVEVTAFAVEGTSLFAGTMGGGAHVSTDNGAHWTAVNAGLANMHVNALAVSGTSLFAGTMSGGIFRSTNNGASWDSVNVGLTNRSVFAFAVSPNGAGPSGASPGGASGTMVIAGTGGGVFVSTNNGMNWIAANQGLGHTYVLALAISGANLVAGTWGGGIWRRMVSDLVSVTEPKDIHPGEFHLAQNYPNPFNPTTELRFEIGDARFVSLKVFDVLGREVTTLVNEEMDPGQYERKLDGSQLAGGVYFCRLQAGSFAETKKLILLK